MPHKHEICKAGKTKQHTFYYAARCDMKEGSRRKKTNETPEAQKKVNRRLSIKKLTWTLNENFDGTSLYVTWSFSKENRPSGKEELREIADKLLRDIRRMFKKEGRQAKYVWVAERGERGATHIHMVLNAIDTRKLKKVWSKGFISITPLDDTGQYRKLAEYLVKYSEKTMKTCEGFGGKRYNSSRNLKIPQPQKYTVSGKNAYDHTIEIPEGYYLDKDSIAEAWHEVTGFMYFTYTLIRDDRRRERTKRKYTLDLETGEVEITEKPGKEKRKNVWKFEARRGHGADERDRLGELEHGTLPRACVTPSYTERREKERDGGGKI